MRLSEATNINMNILQQLTNMVLDKLPDKIGKSIFEDGLTIRINAEEFKEKYPKFKDFFDHIAQTRFLFLNAMQYESDNTKGFYNPTANVIGVNVSGIMGMYRIYTKKELLEKNENIFGIHAVLYHEIRHIMQHKEYPDYFKKDVETKDYRKKDIEIDAMWTNIIGTYNVKKFKPRAFANRVMDDLSHHRDLTQKQYNHFYKKTLKYYSDPEHFEFDKDNNTSTKDFKIENIVPKKISHMIQQLPREYDLTNIKNYNNNNFLFPVERVRSSVLKTLKNGTETNNFTKNMMFILASFVVPNTNLANLFQVYMKNVHNYTVEDVINNLEVGMPKNHFDYDAIKNHLQITFGNINEGALSTMAKAGAIGISSLMPTSTDTDTDSNGNISLTRYDSSQEEIRPKARPYKDMENKTRPKMRPEDDSEKIIRPKARPDKETITDEVNEKVLLAVLKKIYKDKKEIAAFMAQAYHETHGFKSLEEYGDEDYFKKYDIRYNPRKAKMLGNTNPGDGYKYRGRSFNHITGRYNYQKLQDALGIPVVDNPALLSNDIMTAAKAAVYYWNKRVRNNVSDWDDVKQVTKKINGGIRGLKKREELYKHYLQRINNEA